MRKIWMALSAVLGVIALIFVFKKDFDKAFVVAAIGAIAWFLSYRVQMKELIDSVDQGRRETRNEEEED